jgi:hypothetical protein
MRYWRFGRLTYGCEKGSSTRPTTDLTLALPRVDATLPNNPALGIGIVNFMSTALGPNSVIGGTHVSRPNL